jgi:hypothetical protein
VKELRNVAPKKKVLHNEWWPTHNFKKFAYECWEQEAVGRIVDKGFLY